MNAVPSQVPTEALLPARPPLPFLNRLLLGHHALCLAVTVLVVVLRAGLGATSYEATDSAGNRLGFNDPITLEHYGMMLRNFRPAALWEQELFHESEFLYDAVLAGMVIVGACQLVSAERSRRRLTRWFFLAQAAVFPFAALMFPVALIYLRDFAAGRLDREAFVDLPATWVLTQPLWVTVALTAAWALPGEPLGVTRAVRALRSRIAGGTSS